MTTLNNQQINPGNRVDFSHIRSKARVKKFQNPDGGIESSDFQWDKFYTDLNNLTGKKLIWQDEKQKFKDFKNTQTYTDFTNYLKGLDPTKISELGQTEQQYIRWLNSQAGNKKRYQLLDENGELLQNWKDTFEKLRNKNIYGYYSLTPEASSIVAGMLSGEVEAVAPAKTKTQPGETTTEQDPSQHTNPVTILPPYQKGKQNDSHLGQIYGHVLYCFIRRIGYIHFKI